MPAPTKARFYTTSSRKATASNGTTLVTIFTAILTSIQNPDGSAGNGGRLVGVRISNPDTIAHGYTIHLVPSGGTAGVDTVIENVTSGADAIQPGAVAYFAPPIPLPYTDGDFVQIKMAEVKATTEMQFLPIATELAA